MSEIETMNEHMVALQGDKIIMLMPPRGPMAKEEALRLAAWVVVLADYTGDDFAKVLEAVKNT